MSTWNVYLDGRAWSESQLHSSSPYPFSIALYWQAAFFPLRKEECWPLPILFQVEGGFCTRLDQVFVQVTVLCPSVELSGCLEQALRANQAYSTFPSSQASLLRDAQKIYQHAEFLLHGLGYTVIFESILLNLYRHLPAIIPTSSFQVPSNRVGKGLKLHPAEVQICEDSGDDFLFDLCFY